MARTRQDRKLVSPSARVALKVRPEPYWRTISKGLAIGYRKGTTGGTWIARHFSVATKRRVESIGIADDHENADGVRILSFDQAQKKVHKWIGRLTAEETGGVVAGPYTVARALDDYVAERESATRAPKDRDRAIIEAHIKPILGHIELNKLTHGKVKAWRDALAQAAPRKRTGFVKEKVWCVRTVHGKKRGQYKERATKVSLPPIRRLIDQDDTDALRKRQASANRILTILKAALNQAHSENNRVSSNAAWANVKPFRKVDVPKVRFLTIAEVSSLIPACEPDIQRLVKAALLTGCRYGELVAMNVESFDEGHGTAYVAKSKNGESRYVDLNDEGIALFAEITKKRKPKELIFLRSNGKPWKHSEQQRPMNNACEAAKIEGVTFHILRHTYASHSLMNGMTMEVLAQQLGHKDTRITMRHYAHLCPTFKQESVRRNAPSFGFAGNRPGPVLLQASA
jgi:integrase